MYAHSHRYISRHLTISAPYNLRKYLWNQFIQNYMQIWIRNRNLLGPYSHSVRSLPNPLHQFIQSFFLTNLSTVHCSTYLKGVLNSFFKMLIPQNSATLIMQQFLIERLIRCAQTNYANFCLFTDGSERKPFVTSRFVPVSFNRIICSAVTFRWNSSNVLLNVCHISLKGFTFEFHITGLYDDSMID